LEPKVIRNQRPKYADLMGSSYVPIKWSNPPIQNLIIKNVKTLLTTVTSGSSGSVEGLAEGSRMSAEGSRMSADEDGGREGDTCTN